MRALRTIRSSCGKHSRLSTFVSITIRRRTKSPRTSATLAESIHARLVPAVGWAPSEKTEILLSDQTDSANGSATALPYDAVRLNVTAPDDMSPLGDVDDWYLELVTHEYTHILHTDHIEGIPALREQDPRQDARAQSGAAALAPRGARRLRGERADERRPAALVDVEHVDARRRARGHGRDARHVLERPAPVAAGQHLVPVRLVLHAVDRRDVRRAGDPRDDRRLRSPDHPVRDQPLDPASDGPHLRAALRGVGRLDAARLRPASRRHPRARLARGTKAHPHGQHGRAPALDPREGMARARRAISSITSTTGRAGRGSGRCRSSATTTAAWSERARRTASS